MRGVDAFDKVWRNIKAFLALQREQRASKPAVSLWFTAAKSCWVVSVLAQDSKQRHFCHLGVQFAAAMAGKAVKAALRLIRGSADRLRFFISLVRLALW